MGRAALVLGCVAKDWACGLARGAPDAEHLHGALIGLRSDGAPSLPLVPYVDVRVETPAMKRVAHNGTCFNRRRSAALPLWRRMAAVRSAACKAQAP